MDSLRNMKDNFTSPRFGIYSDSFHDTVKKFLMEIRTSEISQELFFAYAFGNLSLEQELTFWNAVDLLLRNIVISIYA